MSIWDTLKINLPDYVITTASYKDQKLIASLSNVLQAQDVDELLKWLNHKPFNKKISLQHQKILYVIFDTLSETEVCKLLGISFVKDHNCIHQTILKINNLDTTGLTIMELLSLNTLSSRKKTVFLNQSNRTQQYHEYSIKDVIYDYYLTSGLYKLPDYIINKKPIQAFRIQNMTEESYKNLKDMIKKKNYVFVNDANMLMTSDINPDMTQSKYVRDQKKVLFIVEKAHGIKDVSRFDNYNRHIYHKTKDALIYPKNTNFRVVNEKENSYGGSVKFDTIFFLEKI